MTTNRTIEVTLPAGARPTADDLDLLQGIFDGIVALGCRVGEAADDAECRLTDEGWTVRSRLMWVADARRGGDYQEVSGRSRADALRHLEQLIRADQVLSPP